MNDNLPQHIGSLNKPLISEPSTSRGGSSLASTAVVPTVPSTAALEDTSPSSETQGSPIQLHEWHDMFLEDNEPCFHDSEVDSDEVK